jgi:hypothetical protein
MPAGRLGETTITWTATAGTLDATCQTVITVTDTEPPQFVCPPDLFLDTDPDQCYATMPLSRPTATDNCTPDPDIDLTAERSDGLGLDDPWPVGATTIKWTVSDGSNTSSCETIVTVTDTQVPVLDCVKVKTLTADQGDCTARFSPEIPIFKDNCIAQIEISGVRSDSKPLAAPWDIGVTSIIWTASGGSNLTCETEIIVIDDQQPIIVSIPEIILETDTGECHATFSPVTPEATDNCAVQPVVSGVRSDGEPLDNPYPVGITTIVWSASDGTNTGSNQTIIRVLDTEPPVITCPAALTINAPPGACDAVITADTPQLDDNCLIIDTQLNWTITHKDTQTGQGTGFVPSRRFEIGQSVIAYSLVGFPAIGCLQEINVIDNGCAGDDENKALFIPEGFFAQ